METDIITQVGTSEPDSRSTLDKAGLGQDAFLKIFLAQLENQDPLSPQDTSELSAQLAQFSQLEQSLRMAQELKGVNTRLDQLVELFGGSTANMQPLSLLGREVEVDGNQLRLPDVGTSLPLRFTLPDEASLLQIEVDAPGGDPLGLFQLRAGTNSEGQTVPLQSGGYELTFRDGEPLLRLPGGAALPIEMVQLARQGDAVVQRTDESGATIPFQFAPGSAYEFAVGGTDAQRQPLVVATTTSGRVEAVSNDTDGPTLTVNGQNVSLSQIIRIR